MMYGNVTSFPTNTTPHQAHVIPQIVQHSKNFMFYSLAVIIPLGLVCNTVSMGVFLTRRMRQRAANWYLAALALSDDVSLLAIMFDYWLKDDRIGINVIRKSHGLCVSVTYLSHASRLFSALLVTSFTIERFISVVYPLKRAQLSSIKHAILVILCEWCLCMLAASYTLFTISVVKASYGTECDVLPQKAELYLVFSVVFLVFGSIVIPIIIICPMNMYILKKIVQRRHFVKKNATFCGHTGPSVRSKKEYNIVTVLLVVSTTFVVLNIPYCFSWIVLYFHHFKLIGPFGGNAEWNMFAAKYITSVLYYLNYSVNFILYSLCARAFRTELHQCAFGLCRFGQFIMLKFTRTNLEKTQRTSDEFVNKLGNRNRSGKPSAHSVQIDVNPDVYVCLYSTDTDQVSRPFTYPMVGRRDLTVVHFSR